MICGLPRPRDLSHVALVPTPVGHVANYLPAIRRCEPEVRRKDVGAQNYGSKMPTFNNSSADRHGLIKKGGVVTAVETPIGALGLKEAKSDHGYMPSTMDLHFLKSEYQGNRHLDPPLRFYR